MLEAVQRDPVRRKGSARPRAAGRERGGRSRAAEAAGAFPILRRGWPRRRSSGATRLRSGTVLHPRHVTAPLCARRSDDRSGRTREGASALLTSPRGDPGPARRSGNGPTAFSRIGPRRHRHPERLPSVSAYFVEAPGFGKASRAVIALDVAELRWRRLPTELGTFLDPAPSGSTAAPGRPGESARSHRLDAPYDAREGPVGRWGRDLGLLPPRVVVRHYPTPR